MNQLLGNALDAHGGLDRWKKIVTVECDLVPGGKLAEFKRSQPLAGALHYVVKTSEQTCAIVVPGGPAKPDVRSVFRPDRVTIETPDGAVVTARDEPRRSFDGHTLQTPWDMLDRLYFGGYTMWLYLTTPFCLAVEGVQIWDIDPLEEDGEIWQGVRIVMPSRYATHSRAQEYYFGSDMLLRRQDYTLDIVGGLPIANYAHDLVEVEGLKLPSKRRAYLCNKKYEVQRDYQMIRLDLTNIRASMTRAAGF